MWLVRRLPVARWAMVLAIAFMLAAPDHWDLSWPGAAHSHGDHHRASHEAHARHCHGDAATCTDLPLTGISGLAALDGWLRLPPAMVATPVPTTFQRAPDAPADVATPPPRRDG